MYEVEVKISKWKREAELVSTGREGSGQTDHYQPQMNVAGAKKSVGMSLTVAVRCVDGVRWHRHQGKGTCLCIDYFR